MPIIIFLLAVGALIEAIWSPRFESTKKGQLWLFYNYRKKPDKVIERKSIQVF